MCAVKCTHNKAQNQMCANPMQVQQDAWTPFEDAPAKC